jgi:hypothetical protein
VEEFAIAVGESLDKLLAPDLLLLQGRNIGEGLYHKDGPVACCNGSHWTSRHFSLLSSSTSLAVSLLCFTASGIPQNSPDMGQPAIFSWQDWLEMPPHLVSDVLF